MSIIDRLFGRRRAEIARGVRVSAVLGKTPEQLYEKQPELRAVVSYVVDAIASTPIKTYTRVDDDDRQRDRTSTAAMLIDNPRDGMSTYQLVERIVGDICLYGAALVIVAPASERECGYEIVPIPYAWVQDELTEDGFEPSAYIVQNPDANTAPTKIQASMTVRFMRYAPGGTVHAVSPVESLKQVLAERMYALDYRNAVWKNGGWVSRWLSRPAGVSWDNEQRSRFAASWKAKFAGENGTDSGGTPILEDGMELHDTTINAKEAQFAESAQLTREEVCAAYHINPSLIYHTQTQTYASAKDNARALYSEALMPVMDLIEERINKALLPMLGADPRTYVAFDLSSKLNASFEEQASVLTSSVGAPWMTADEARARMNMPAIGGNASQLVQPLNVAYGDNGVSNSIDGNKLSGVCETKATKEEEPEKLSYKTQRDPDADGAAELDSTLSQFFKRQSKRVLPEIDRAKSKGAIKASNDNDPPWWDSKRWNRELADDLEPIFQRLATASGLATLRDIEMNPDDYDEARTAAYIRKMAEGKAAAINIVTLRQLEKALGIDEDDVDDDVAGDTPAGVFEKAESARASVAAVSFATACAVWGCMEAVRQCAPPSKWEREKKWVHVPSKNQRSSHAALDGETVDFDEQFSNGAMYPHDMSMTADESCNCRCTIEISITEV